MYEKPIFRVLDRNNDQSVRHTRLAYRLQFRVKTTRDAWDAVDDDGGGGDAEDLPYIKLDYSGFSIRVCVSLSAASAKLYKQIFYSLMTPALQTQH